MNEASAIALLGLDIGTTTCKLVAFDADGTQLAEARQDYVVESPQKGWAELDPDTVFQAVQSVISKVAPSLKRHSSAALAISAQGEAFVPVDADGQALMRAPVTVDARGHDAAEQFRQKFGDEDIAALTGHRLTHWSTLSKLLWMRQSAQDLLSRTQRVYCFGDYVLHRFGLAPAMDYSMAARTLMFDVNRLDWSPRLMDEAGLDISILPPAVPGGTVIGSIDSGLPELGLNLPITVVAGGHDQACAALGAGVISAGTGLYSIGTTESLAIATAGPRQELPLANIPNYPHVVPGNFIAIAGTQNGGRLLEWYRDLAGASDADEILSEMTDLPSTAVLIPHFAGTNTVLDDDTALGVLAGLSFDATRPEITHAVLEGITFDQELALGELRRCGLKMERLTAVGGGARSPEWMQIKADMLGVTIQTLQGGEAACTGAAMLAGLGSGALPTVDIAVSAFVNTSRVFQPRAKFAALYERKKSIYRSIYHSLRPVWPELRKMEDEISALKSVVQSERAGTSDNHASPS